MAKRRKRSTKRRRKGHGTIGRCPNTHYFGDCARSLTQARSMKKYTPKEYDPKIVRTPKYKVFPYHIAVRKQPYRRKK